TPTIILHTHLLHSRFFFLMLPPPPTSTLFPYTTLFRSRYINGREPLPYESVFPKAGIAVARQTQSSPFLGVNAQPGDSGKLVVRSEEHTSELQSRSDLVCRLLLEKKKKKKTKYNITQLA